MKRLHRPPTLFVSGLCVLWLGLAVRQAAQAPAMSVTPANPTISVGQTQQFTASGAIAPTGVSAGGEYTCVRLPDGTARCVGRNQFGQLGDGTIDEFLGARRRSAASPRRRVSPPATSSRARFWPTARRGAGGWGKRASAATAHSIRCPSCPVAVQRPHERRLARGRIQPRLRAPCRRHDAVLGRERRRTARQSVHAARPPPCP